MTNPQTNSSGGLLARKVTERLNQLGMSRRELSRRARLSRQTIHSIEREGATNLKPSTFSALDQALKWEAGTAMALALGHGELKTVAVEERLKDYLHRIAIHLSEMTTDELELCAVMMEENELGTANHNTLEFTMKVATLVEGYMADFARLKEAHDQKNVS